MKTCRYISIPIPVHVLVPNHSPAFKQCVYFVRVHVRMYVSMHVSKTSVNDHLIAYSFLRSQLTIRKKSPCIIHTLVYLCVWMKPDPLHVMHKCTDRFADFTIGSILIDSSFM